MAFWGAEVRAGKPVTHKFDHVKGRLHISQAALGHGSASNKSVVQCNIGDKSPVILCVLLPDKTESCHLDLQFEESDDVIFSVIGSISVHLTGYYSSSRHFNHNDSSESYGVDIANSDSQHSVHGSDEDEYEDSFINDDDPEVFSASPISSDTAGEEMSGKKKLKERNESRKRLKKRYRTVVSEDESNSQMSTHKGNSVLESDDEDCVVISTLLKGGKIRAGENLEKHTSKTSEEKIENGSHLLSKSIFDIDDKSESKKKRNVKKDKTPECVSVLKNDGEDISTLLESKTTQAEENLEKKISETGEKKLENGGTHLQTQDNSVHDEKTDDIDNVAIKESKSKKKRKERKKETVEAYVEIQETVMEDEKLLPLEEKTKEKVQVTNREEEQTCDDLLPSTKSDKENDARPKKKRKKSEGETSMCQTTTESVSKGDKVKHDEGGAQDSGKDISMESKDPKIPHDKNDDLAPNQAVDEDRLKDKKSRKKKEKTQGREENGVTESEKKKSLGDSSDKNVDSKLSKARTLSNGLIIEDIDMGKPDGKVATLGKKVKVHYVGKLRDGGQVFDSNIGKSPLKFRLGAEGVTEGWNIGLDGMRVGGKRRLTIPPANGDGSQGAGENVAPNSWLVYDFELAGVR